MTGTISRSVKENYLEKIRRQNTVGVGLTRSRANSLYRHRIIPLLPLSQGFIRAQIGHQDGELAFFYRYLHKPQPLALYIMHKAGVRCFSVRTVLFPQMDYSSSPPRRKPSIPPTSSQMIRCVYIYPATDR